MFSELARYDSEVLEAVEKLEIYQLATPREPMGEEEMLATKINDAGKPKFFIPAIYPPSVWENTIPIKRTYRYEDYKQLPEGAPYQLIGGELVMTPSPMPYHQEISRELGFRLLTFVKKHDLGHVYYRLLTASR